MSSQSLEQARDRLMVALDVSSLSEAERLAEPLVGRVGWAKVGKQLFVAEGPESVRRLRAKGFRVFLDLKFHDIPNTVASAAVEAMRLGVDLMNVHAIGGRRMMEATVQRVHAEASRLGQVPPRIIAVTVLTSLEAADLEEVGLAGQPVDWVRRWSTLTRDSGLDGVVCSPHEVATLRREHGDDFLLVTPGIRPPDAAPDDQRRTMSAGEAIAAGASKLVIGRPLTAAAEPAAAADAFAREVASMLPAH